MSTFLWILLVFTSCVLRITGYSVNVTRGYRDFIYTNIRQPSSTGGLICDYTGFCACKEDTTYILDSDSFWRGKCVRDYEIIEDRSNGKFLPRRSGCIGVTKNETIVKMSCAEDDLSVRWIWTIDSQMLNLKTLKCLQVERKTRKKVFLVEQCNTSDRQKWVCTKRNRVKNKEVQRTSMQWIIPGNHTYFQDCNRNIYSYKGCYRFPDGKFMKLINTTLRCDTFHNGTCGLEIKIQAPINAGYTSCQLDWPSSVFTISGFDWRSFTEPIAGVQLNSTIYPATLKINNRSAFMSKWKGHLLRLDIQCSNNVGRFESHCALLKVEGTATDEIPPRKTANLPSTSSTPTTSQLTSSSKSPHTPDNQTTMTSTTTSFQTLSSTGTSDPEKNSQDVKNKEDSSIILPIIISAAILFCLLIVAVVIVFVCKRRKKKPEDLNKNEEHIYEEAYPVDNANGPVSPIYMDIDNLTRSKSKKSDSSHTYQEPTENPFYHTLERKAERHVEDNGIYEQIDEIAKAPTPKEFEKEVDV